MYDARLFKAKQGNPTRQLQSFQFLASHNITAVDGFHIWQRHLVNRAWFWGNLYSPAA
jgi:hypothetical protein